MIILFFFLFKGTKSLLGHLLIYFSGLKKYIRSGDTSIHILS